MKKGLQKKILGFTLVEIMIVVTIIGILASLAVPAFQRARWKALETSIRNNLRQVWGAAQQYMLENGVSEIVADDYKKIFLWRTKDGSGGTATREGAENPGYTSVIQQIAEESYDAIYVYDSTTITSYVADEKVNTDIPQSTTLSEDTQGLAVAVGTAAEGQKASRYVKLRL